MTMSIAFFDCPTCIDSFAFDWQRLEGLRLHSRVMVRCPGCGNTVEIVTNAYSLVHNCDPDKYQWGEILEILPPDTNTNEESIRFNTSLHFQIHRKKYGWRPG